MKRTFTFLCLLFGCVLGALAAQNQLKTVENINQRVGKGVKKHLQPVNFITNPDYQKINRQQLAKGTRADVVFVDKSKRRMYLKRKGKILRVYHIALGDSPKGHKVKEGDEKTPEGTYVLDWKNENSIAHRSIHISYPNAKDKAHAKKLGVSPGGAIMIHGQMNGYGHLAPIMQQRDWTDGCIAVTDKEMDEIMSLVKVGTPINIVW